MESTMLVGQSIAACAMKLGANRGRLLFPGLMSTGLSKHPLQIRCSQLLWWFVTWKRGHVQCTLARFAQNVNKQE